MGEIFEVGDVDEIHRDRVDEVLIFATHEDAAFDQRLRIGPPLVTIVGGLDRARVHERQAAVLGDAGLHTQVTTTGAVQIQATGQERAFAVAGALAVTTQGKSGGIAAVYNEGSHVTEALLREAQTQVFAGTDVSLATIDGQLLIGWNGRLLRIDVEAL